jgi:nucleoprotein TPR
VMEAKEELAIAQEAAAASAAHAAHFKAIAAKNEECLKDMQTAHDAFRAEAAAAASAAAASKSELEKELATERQSLSDANTRLLALREVEEKAATLNLADVDRMRTDLAARTAEVAALTERTKTLEADVERYMTQWRQAKALYEEEVMKHAENIKKMQGLENKASSAAALVRDAEARAADALSTLAASQVAWEAQRAELASTTTLAQNKAAEMTEQNAHLHQQLEAFAHAAEPTAAADGGDADADVGGATLGAAAAAGPLAEVVAYLRREKETVEVRLRLKEHEASRAVADAARARKEAEEARAQV